MNFLLSILFITPIIKSDPPPQLIPLIDNSFSINYNIVTETGINIVTEDGVTNIITENINPSNNYTISSENGLNIIEENGLKTVIEADLYRFCGGDCIPWGKYKKKSN